MKYINKLKIRKKKKKINKYISVLIMPVNKMKLNKINSWNINIKSHIYYLNSLKKNFSISSSLKLCCCLYLQITFTLNFTNI